MRDCDDTTTIMTTAKAAAIMTIVVITITVYEGRSITDGSVAARLANLRIHSKAWIILPVPAL